MERKMLTVYLETIAILVNNAFKTVQQSAKVTHGKDICRRISRSDGLD